MVFHRNHCRVSPKIINELADDLIYIANISRNKDKYRNLYIKERLENSSKNSFLTSYEINDMISTLSKKDTDISRVHKILKQVNKKIYQQYTTLTNIFEGLMKNGTKR